MRQNGRVTERIELPEAFTPGAVRVHQATTSPARLIIVQYLLANPGATFADLGDDLDMSMAMIHKSVAQLRDHDYLVEERRGRTIHFTANRRKIAGDLAELLTVMLG